MNKDVSDNKTMLVFDCANPERGRAIGESFAGFVKNIYFSDAVELLCYRDSRWSTVHKWPVKAELVFIHGNDYEKWSDRKLEIDGIEIKYTGGAARRSADDGYYWIRKRAIFDRSDAPEETEVKELVDWMAVKNQDNLADLPSLLSDEKKAPEILLSLTLLCQGYLAVHAVTDSQKDMKRIEPALRQMGWFDVPEEIRKSLELQFVETQSQVMNKRWWLDVFGIPNNESVVEVKETKRNKFLEQVAGEWRENSGKELSGAVNELVELLINDDKEVMPDVVARAYCAIATVLGGRSC